MPVLLVQKNRTRKSTIPQFPANIFVHISGLVQVQVQIKLNKGTIPGFPSEIFTYYSKFQTCTEKSYP